MKTALTPALQNDVYNIAHIQSIPSILNVICKTTGMGFAAVARVTDEKWITCVSQDEINFGIGAGDELVLETTICNEIRQHHHPIIIDEVSKCDKFRDHHTPARYGFQSYISFPIFRKDGSFFGTLCAIDPKPAKLDNKETIELFELFSQLISFHLNVTEELHELTASLKQERLVAEVRDTFIAILGHDLRNPVGTTRMCADILLKMNLPAMARKQASTIKSTSYRMQGLIDNVLDFAKGHLGEGIRLELDINRQELKKALSQVARELNIIYADRQINTIIELKEDVECDINRITQLYSNLLGNALKHGALDKPVFSEIRSENKIFSIEVSNSGDRIPEEIKINLFKPFFTTNAANNKSGLGLGLYISTEIAKAHGGNIIVDSTSERTTFKFTMPSNGEKK